jgi:hypothetical protein
VLATLEKSVVYVTTETIEPLLMNHGYDRSAWDLANLYLGSLGADPLGRPRTCVPSSGWQKVVDVNHRATPISRPMGYV